MYTDYKLLDTGNFERLERFGSLVVRRAAKQADWKPSLSEEEWERADIVFDGENWNSEDASFQAHFDEVVFDLKPMSMGQVGIFPEQVENWHWLNENLSNSSKEYKIINGFAYTGGSTLFSSYKNTDVTHLDALKSAIGCAQKNAELSGKSENKIRYINDDVLTFLQREAKRNNKYDGFIFDPPAFGRGGKGKVWKLKKDIYKLAELVDKLSGGEPKLLLFTGHDVEFGRKDMFQMVADLKGVDRRKIEQGDLIMHTESGQEMKNGYFVRYFSE